MHGAIIRDAITYIITKMTTCRPHPQRVLFDMRPPWYWTTGRVVPDIIIGVLLIIAALSGRARQVPLGRWVFAETWAVGFAIWTTSALGEHLDGKTDFSFWWYLSLACLTVYLSIRFLESYFIQLSLFAVGSGCLFVAVLEYVVFRWNPAGVCLPYCVVRVYLVCVGTRLFGMRSSSPRARHVSVKSWSRGRFVPVMGTHLFSVPLPHG